MRIIDHNMVSHIKVGSLYIGDISERYLHLSQAKLDQKFVNMDK